MGRISAPKNLDDVQDVMATVDENGLYFIERRGGLFRPEAKGYTTQVSQAGLYTGADAKGYLSVDGISLIPAEDLVSRLESEKAAIEASLKSAEVALETLKEKISDNALRNGDLEDTVGRAP